MVLWSSVVLNTLFIVDYHEDAKNYCLRKPEDENVP